MTGRIEFTLETGQDINCDVSQLTLLTTKDEFWTWISGHAAGTVSHETYTWLTGVLYPPEFVKSATTNAKVEPRRDSDVGSDALLAAWQEYAGEHSRWPCENFKRGWHAALKAAK